VARARQAIDEGAQALIVEGAFAQWRIFGTAIDLLAGRPNNVDDWSRQITNWPAKDDTTRLTLGDIPASILDAIRSARAHLQFLLSRPSLSPAELDEVVRRAAEGVDVGDVTGNMRTWLTVEIQRPVVLEVEGNNKALWRRGTPDSADIAAFQAEATNALDLSGAWLLPALGAAAPEHVMPGGERVVFIAPGRMPIPLPLTNQVGRVTVSLTRPWTDLDIHAIDHAATTLPRSDAAQKALRTPAKWYWDALREDQDQLRQFLFAWFGLETLANKFGSRVAKEYVAELSQRLDGLPLDQLVWPQNPDQDPYRNVSFNFAIMASKLSPTSSAMDTAKFIEIARVRNNLAHGAGSDHLQRLPWADAVELLGRYLNLVSGDVSAPAPEGVGST
jgi:hypothetical protein